MSRGMTLHKQLNAVVGTFVAHTGLRESVASLRLFGDNRTIKMMRAGRLITLFQAERAIQRAADILPADAWPEGVYRPSPSVAAAAE
jgi:hypothetical protein